MTERERKLHEMSTEKLLNLLANSEDENYVDLVWEELHQRDLMGVH